MDTKTCLEEKHKTKKTLHCCLIDGLHRDKLLLHFSLVKVYYTILKYHTPQFPEKYTNNYWINYKHLRIRFLVIFNLSYCHSGCCGKTWKFLKMSSHKSSFVKRNVLCISLGNKTRPLESLKLSVMTFKANIYASESIRYSSLPAACRPERQSAKVNLSKLAHTVQIPLHLFHLKILISTPRHWLTVAIAPFALQSNERSAYASACKTRKKAIHSGLQQNPATFITTPSDETPLKSTSRQTDACVEHWRGKNLSVIVILSMSVINIRHITYCRSPHSESCIDRGWLSETQMNLHSW